MQIDTEKLEGGGYTLAQIRALFKQGPLERRYRNMAHIAAFYSRGSRNRGRYAGSPAANDYDIRFVTDFQLLLVNHKIPPRFF